MQKILILEDNDIQRYALAALIQKSYPNIEVFQSSDISTAYSIALANHIDLFLLDVILTSRSPNDSSGYIFAKKIRTLDEYTLTPIVFTTTLNELMVQAFRSIHCYDYLVKPIRESELKEILYNTLIKGSHHELQNKKVTLRSKGTIYSILLQDILYVETRLRKLYVYTIEETLEFPYMSLANVLALLNDNRFTQCHRAIIVNKDYVERVHTINRTIQLRGTHDIIDIGAQYLALFQKEFEE